MPKEEILALLKDLTSTPEKELDYVATIRQFAWYCQKFRDTGDQKFLVEGLQNLQNFNGRLFIHFLNQISYEMEN